MCFFLNLEVSVQTRSIAVNASINRLATSYGLCLRGAFPSYQVTDGHCSCHQVVSEGHAIKPVVFLQELLCIEDIKNVKVGWTWATGQDVAMKPETSEVRLPFHEFVVQNAAVELCPDVWYRIHDADKYKLME